MKRRVPGRFSAAISRIRTGLGETQCAKVVGKSPSLVRKWSDPDQPSLPGLRQALALDVAFVTAGLGEPPIATTYAERLDRLVKETPNETIDVILSILSMQATMGALAHRIITSGIMSGEDQGNIAEKEKHEVLRLLDHLCDEAGSMKEHLVGTISAFDK